MAERYELADTEPARLLSTALARAKAERGLSIRQLAKQLDINQAVVISHMALGRMPIPIDRAEQLAEALDMDAAEFLSAVVRQRHPNVHWDLLQSNPGEELSEASSELELIAGMPLRQLSSDHKVVLREVVGSAHPRRRWLSEHEVPVITALRAERPRMQESGLDETDLAKLKSALTYAPRD